MELMCEGEFVNTWGVLDALAHGPCCVLMMQWDHGIVSQCHGCRLLGEFLTLLFIHGCQRGLHQFVDLWIAVLTPVPRTPAGAGVGGADQRAQTEVACQCAPTQQGDTEFT